MAEKLTCGQCGQQFSERQLVTKSATVELCPGCGTLYRFTEKMSFRDEDQIRLQDVAAIDTWIDQLSQAGIKASAWADSTGGREQFRRIEGGQRQTEIVYDKTSLGFVAVRFTTAGNISGKGRQLQAICATHGVQPYAVSGTDSRWGAEQWLSTNLLCPDLFTAVRKRLEAAMTAAEPEMR